MSEATKRHDRWLESLRDTAGDMCACGVERSWGRHEGCGRVGDGYCHTARCHPFEPMNPDVREGRVSEEYQS